MNIGRGKMNCPTCGNQATFVQQNGLWYCYSCQRYLQVQAPAQPVQQYPQGVVYQQPVQQYGQPQGMVGLWYQNFYRIKRKVLAIGNKYWIENANGQQIGFSKQKIFALKDEIKIFSDENMNAELFKIKQTQIIDAWGNFAVTDSMTNQLLGHVKRKYLASMFRNEWEIMNAQNQVLGGIYESNSAAMTRRFISEAIPDHLTIQLNGALVAEIDQKFKFIGDEWTLNCVNVPPYLDRRVLLACLLLMGMIEEKEDRKR